VIDALFIAQVVAGAFGSWALGFGIGKAVAWVRQLGYSV